PSRTGKWYGSLGSFLLAPSHRLPSRLRCSILILSGHVMKLILASASPRRAAILRDAGYHFTVLSSAVDETPYPEESPEDLVLRLAQSKADLAAARSVGPAILIAADTEVVLDGQIFGKPRSSRRSPHAQKAFRPHPHRSYRRRS